MPSTYSTGSVSFLGSGVTIHSTVPGAIVFSAAGAGTGGGMAGIVASDATYTSGTVVFTGSNAATVKSGAGQQVIIDVPIQTAFVLSQSNGFTFGTNASTVTASFSESTHSHSTGPSGISASNTVYTSGTVEFIGSNAVTVRTGNPQQVVIDMTESTHAHSAFVFSNSNGLAWGTNGSTVTGSYTQSTHSHSAGGVAISASDALYTSGTVAFTGSNLITIATSGTGTQQTVVVSGHNHGGISASNALFTSGTVVFSGGTNITVNTSGTGTQQTIGFSVAPPIAIAASNATYTSGTVVFSGGANVTVNTSGAGANQTVGFSAAAAAAISYYDNLPGGGSVIDDLGAPNMAGSNQSLFISPLNPPGNPFPGNMTVSTWMVDISVSTVALQVSLAHTSSINLGLYSISTAAGAGSTLGLVNSVQSVITLPLNAGNGSFWHGQRFLTIHSSQWSAQPVLSAGIEYYVGFGFNSSVASNAVFSPMGHYIGGTAGSRSGTFGVSNPAAATHRGHFPYHGVFSTLTAGMPASIHQSEVNKNVSVANFVPHFILNNRISSF